MSRGGALAVAGLGALGFTFTALLVASGHANGIDRLVLERVVAARPAWLVVLAREVTALGNISAVLAISALAAALVWRTPHRRLAPWLLAVAVVAWAAPEVAKAVFARGRPGEAGWAAAVSSPSFPSGHAVQSALAWGAVAVAVRRVVGGTIGRTAVLVGGTLPLLIGASRVVLGVHFPSDVAAGWCLGWGLLGVASLAVRPPVRPPD